MTALPSPDATPPIAVIGLGYVGLQLSLAFSHHHDVTGFDINATRINELKGDYDRSGELTADQLAGAGALRFTAQAEDLAEARIYIVTVPTPVDDRNQPDFTPLIRASETVGMTLKAGDVVIYESTVYPGATEEICAPVLERVSGLTRDQGFWLGYSPERVNPGDKNRTVTKIEKITAGSTPQAAKFVDALYARIIEAGTYRAESIRVAEAAKVIENTQRDVNIALVNELAMIFGSLGIDTEAVIKAAATKWNFHPYRPGLVGGHCISVDPYYLTYKAQSIGLHPELILTGRRINDGMASYVASRMIKALIAAGVQINGARLLVMGATFKENSADLRNTRVIDLVRELREYGAEVDIHDPWALPDEAEAVLGEKLIQTPQNSLYQGVLVAVRHRQYVDAGVEAIRTWCTPAPVIFDLKNVLPAQDATLRL